MLIMRFLLVCLSLNLLISTSNGEVSSGLSMIGKPALPNNFTHFPYAASTAPQGGKFTFGVVGTFDSINPFVTQSMRSTARGLFADQQFGSFVYETLMTRSMDEPFTLYGLIAEKVDINDERTQAIFYLNPKARFSDGNSVTVEDVIFTMELLKEKGRPPFTDYARRIIHMEKVGNSGIKFIFKSPADREFPLIIASSMPILPKHAINIDTFEKGGLTIIPGSGPYVIDRIDPGDRIIYRRNPDYWGRDLAVNCGVYNFERIQIEYFRNENANFEAFKKGILDVFVEELPYRWKTSYNFPAVRDGRVIKESFRKNTPAPMKAIIFNTRREIFSKPEVREALSQMFDFNWVNRNLYNLTYRRTEGFWDGSELSAIGRPANERERELLAPFPNAVAPDVMEGRWHTPEADGSGMDRKQAENAWKKLLAEGFTRKGGKVFGPDGKVFTFEFMTKSLEQEKIALIYRRSLARLGIDVTVRTVDDAQYQNRLSSFDYDMIIFDLSASMSPGNEQLNRWASSSRNREGSFNFAGVANPAVDAMIKAMLDARSKEDYVSAVRALDRVLISGHYYLPLYHLPDQWVARWSRIGHPDYTPLFGYRFPVWWRQN